jgi:hypothetical protein
MGFAATLASLGLLALVPASRTGPSQPLRLRIATAPDAVVDSCDSAVVESRLAARLSRSSLRVVSPDEPTDLRAEIVECVVATREKAVSSIQGTPLKLPTGRAGVMTGGEQEYDVHTETTRRVVLKVRLTSGHRSLDVVSDPVDQNLGQATKTVGKAIERTVKDRRSWLLGRPE